MSGSARATRLLSAAALLALTLVVLLPESWRPPGRDSGVFLSLGAGILRGDVPYRDLWDHKAPLIYFVNALGLALGGGRTVGVWVLELFSLLGAGWVSWRLLRTHFGPVVGGWVVLSWMGSVIELLERGNLTEEYTLPLQWMGLALFARASTSPRRGDLFGLGGVAAACFLLRQNHIGLFVAMVLVLLLQRGDLSWGAAIRHRIVPLFLGGLLTVLAMLSYFAAAGALGELWDAAFHYNAVYVDVDATRRLRALGFGLERVRWSAAALLAWLVLLVPAWRARAIPPSARALVLAAWLALPLELLLGSLSGKAMRHYYLVWLASFSVLFATLLRLLWSAAREASRGFARWLPAGALVLLAAASVVVWPFDELAESYRESRNPAAWSRTRGMLDAIEHHSDRADRILVWGAQSELHALSGRAPASRYIYQYPLVTRGYADGAMIARFVGEVQRSRPALIVDTAHPVLPPLAAAERETWAAAMPVRSPGSYGLPPPGLEPFFEMVERDYESIAVLEGWQLLRRRRFSGESERPAAPPSAADHR